MVRAAALMLSLAACTPAGAPADAGTDAGAQPADAGVKWSSGGLGATLSADGLHVGLLSQRATRIELSLFTGPTEATPVLKADLARESGTDRWSVTVPTAQLPQGTLYYGYRASGPADAGDRFDESRLLIDPWARELSHDPFPLGAPKAVVLTESAYDTGTKPTGAFADDVIYEVHLRGFSRSDPAAPAGCAGTYAGAAARAQKLKALGVTAIELLPVHETQNDQNEATATADGDNYWGYSTLAFFAPDRRYACDQSPGGPTREFAAMVKAFHDAGLKVFLDVVYNHTAEGSGGRSSLRLLDNAGYYELDAAGTGFRDDTGVGANVNVANPMTQELILGSLRYFVQALGIDGFRFDLASMLGNTCAQACFAFDATVFPARIARELPGTVLIAEPWAITPGTYQLGNFGKGWSEWNGEYRDAVRRVQNKLNVDAVTPRQVREALAGSPAKFAGRSPVNYLVSHDGFTLKDLYACNMKDNAQAWPYGPSNGGEDNNLSWDQGGDPARQRQAVRTGLAVLFTSAGVPMVTGGDELYRSQRCNNNPFNLDSVGTWVDWAALEAANADVQTLTTRLLALRAAHPALRSGTRSWVRANGSAPDDGYYASAASTFLGFVAGDTLVAWNWGTSTVAFSLPSARPGKAWHLAGDTAELAFTAEGGERPIGTPAYDVRARSLAVFVEQ